jgi:hypothetical protein
MLQLDIQNLKTLIDSLYATNEQQEQAQEELPVLNNLVIQHNTLTGSKEDRAHKLNSIQQTILDLNNLIIAGTQSGLNQPPHHQKKRKEVENAMPGLNQADNEMHLPPWWTKCHKAT